MNKVERAILFATSAHAGARRKGKDRAYILHPLEVMTIAAGLTEDEDVLCAAVLHDTVEDTGTALDTIRSEFGDRVAELVAGESENKREDRPAEETWLVRKQETVDRLPMADRDTKLICLGDKLSNLREMSRDYAVLGDRLWERFHQKEKRMHCWYYRSICNVLEQEFGLIRPVREYRELLDELFHTDPH